MKLLILGGLALAGAIVALQTSPKQVVILSGDTAGYLAPCGCTSPMIGGIKRRVSAIRALSQGAHATILDNGGSIRGLGRQDEIKAETVAQILGASGATAINLGTEEARIGPGLVSQISRLSGGKLISASLDGYEGVSPFVENGPFLVGGASRDDVGKPLGAVGVSVDQAVGKLVDAAKEHRLVPILMLRGNGTDAKALAAQFPDLRLIEYSSAGDPPAAPVRVGKTILATPGEQGKHIIRLTWDGQSFGGYTVVALGPEVSDDPTASRFYNAYLRRVTAEHLLEQLPRKGTAAFAGSWSCVNCHTNGTRIWKHSGHRIAYQTLERAGHGKDPDCVSCHVVGLESTAGFRTKEQTPQLAGVGCESCHGPSLDHAWSPPRYRLAKVHPRQCVTCHNPQNSPNFDFPSYWKKIAHK